MFYRVHFVLLLIVVALVSAGCMSSQAAQAPLASSSAPVQSAPTQAAPAEATAAPAATTAPVQAASTQPAPPQPTATESAQAQVVPPTPTCANLALTPAETEGPYFKAGSPERTSLLQAGMAGTKLVVTGYVVTSDCKPVTGALLDFWQADANGNYDNSGYTLRGHLFTDTAGRFQLTTIVPGQYPGRTEHIHVKVQAPNGPVLTTQLYFPGVAGNQRDGIFDPTMLLAIQKTGDGLIGTYNFVVNSR